MSGPKFTGVAIDGRIVEKFAKKMHEIADDIITDDDGLAEKINDAEIRLIEEMAQKHGLPEWVLGAVANKQGFWQVTPVRPRLTKGRMLLDAQEVRDAKDAYGED